MVDQLLIFSVDDHRFGVRLGCVTRVVRMPAITLLPGAPAAVRGVVNAGGTVVPVMNLRRRFGLPLREPRLEDHLVLARTRKREVALPIDAAHGIESCDDVDVTRGEVLAPGLRYVEGVARLASGLVFIHDLETFLSQTEEAELDAALSASTLP